MLFLAKFLYCLNPKMLVGEEAASLLMSPYYLKATLPSVPPFPRSQGWEQLLCVVNVECNLYFRLVYPFQVALGNLKQFLSKTGCTVSTYQLSLGKSRVWEATTLKRPCCLDFLQIINRDSYKSRQKELHTSLSGPGEKGGMWLEPADLSYRMVTICPMGPVPPLAAALSHHEALVYPLKALVTFEGHWLHKGFQGKTRQA